MAEDLSPREAQALRAVCRAGHGAEAARELGISRQTLKNHLTAVYRKLGVSGAAMACYGLGRADGRATGRRAADGSEPIAAD